MRVELRGHERDPLRTLGKSTGAVGQFVGTRVQYLLLSDDAVVERDDLGFALGDEVTQLGRFFFELVDELGLGLQVILKGGNLAVERKAEPTRRGRRDGGDAGPVSEMALNRVTCLDGDGVLDCLFFELLELVRWHSFAHVSLSLPRGVFARVKN